MFFTSSYVLIPRSDGGLWCQYLSAREYCPKCGNVLTERDRRKRCVRYCGGEKSYILVRRMYCPECGRLHVELPDNLIPYKQYEAAVIEAVVDRFLDENDPRTIEGPTKIGMKLWINWLNSNLYHFSNMYSRAFQKTQNDSDQESELPASLMTLRKYGTGWLSAGISFVYNSGLHL